MSVLNELRQNRQYTTEVLPEANFQRMILSDNVVFPQQNRLPIAPQLAPKRTSVRTTSRATQPTVAVQPTPGIRTQSTKPTVQLQIQQQPRVGQILIPQVSTMIPRATSRTLPVQTTARQPTYTANPVIDQQQIDIEKLRASTTNQRTGTYTQVELKEIANRLGLRSSGTKKELADRILEKLVQVS